MKTRQKLFAAWCCTLCLLTFSAAQAQTDNGSVLSFPPPPSESVVKSRLQDSKMKWPKEPQRLPADAPNILIVLIDDIGFGVADTFGGEVHTPTLTRLAKEGIRYNAFHTTSICSPTRAALLTGRNHTRVGSGTIAERAVAFDGYTGIMPKTAATVAEVLKEYGYHTSAFGKWHNTPATETTAMGPKDRWPNGYGFEYFIPEDQRAFQSRLMEVFAGFMEHTDHQIGEMIDRLEQRGLKENTIIFYIVGDNGSSAEGQQGSISELLAQNGIPNTIEQQINAMKDLGGLDALGGPDMVNMYHAGWAWAGCTPLRSTKLVAAHFGGTCNPMVVSWPKGIKPDKTIRNQFHHVVDIAPTLYKILGIPHPKVVYGHKQMSMDGISLAYTFADGAAEGRKKTQFFDNNGSRGVYHDGWFASAFGPFTPWKD